jgi:molybdopterin converting factor small subunit
VTVAVRLFARARDLAGSGRVELLVGPEPTVGTVRSALLMQCPQLAPLGPHLLAAVNSAYAEDCDRLPAGAEVAFFPPVSGG